MIFIGLQQGKIDMRGDILETRQVKEIWRYADHKIERFCW
jgi:hypothetical protein